MEDLLRALRNIGLALPDHEQLLQLSDPDPEVQDKLAQLLALNSSATELQDEPAATPDEQADSDDDQPPVDPLIDADLFKGAVQALLENYNKFIDKERDALKREAEQLDSPKKIKPVPLKALLARQSAEIKRRAEEYYAAGYETESGKPRKRFYLPRQTFDGFGSYSSEAPLSQLTRLDSDEFQCPKRFTGRYILCQVASSLNLYVSCTFIATLPSGNAIPVSISHFTPNLHLAGDKLDTHLPVGTILAIREPFLSLNHFSKGGPALGGKSVPGIRVDTPSDVHIVDRLSSLDAALLQGVTWKTDIGAAQVIDTWRHSPTVPNTKGCRWLQDGPLSRFLAWKQDAEASPPTQLEAELDSLSPGERDALFQRTQQLCVALLESDRPGAAHRELCACRVLRLGEDLELEGRVLHRLGRFADAVAAYETVLKAPTTSEGQRERIYPRLNAARTALSASTNGPSHEHVWSYYFESQALPTPRFDLADWIGPVAVRDIPGAGRGLVLTREVQPGELLLACKAAASSYAEDATCRGIHVLRYTVETGVTSTTTQVLAATKSLLAMLDRRDLVLPIMGLTAGPGVPYSRWVEQPYPTPGSTARSSPAPAPLGLNAAYVDGVLRFNAFGPAPNPAASASSSELTRSTMVHPLPAILNHACLPNVSSVFFGDLVTTRALHVLPAGTEIAHQYVRGSQAYSIRSAQLSKHGFECQCLLCRLDRADGEGERTRARMIAGTFPVLVQRSDMLSGSADSELEASLRDLVAQINATYKAPERGELKPDLMQVWHRIAMHASSANAREAQRNALRCIGAVVDDTKTGSPLLTRLPDLHFDGAIESLLALARLEPNRAELWAQTALWAHDCTIGGGPDVFLDRWEQGYPDLPLQAWLKEERKRTK